MVAEQRVRQAIEGPGAIIILVLQHVAREHCRAPRRALDDQLGELPLGGNPAITTDRGVLNQPLEHRYEIASAQTVRHRPGDVALQTIDVYGPSHRYLS
jgi:hypothetical protein